MVMIRYWLIKRGYKVTFLLFLAVAPVVFFFWPSEYIFNGHSICLFRNVLGTECYGCGMVRALYSALHLRFAESVTYNILVIIVGPLLLFVWGKRLYRGIKS